MRISWLEPDAVRITRAAMKAHHPDWAVHFHPEFRAPAPPTGFDALRWPQIAEHVARAEWVSHIIRESGLDAAIARFSGSGHAIEQATLIAAAIQSDRLELALVVGLLECEIDDLIAYGSFLELLQKFRATQGDQALATYESFCAAFSTKASDLPHWRDRVDAVRDGLAGFYVSCGRLDRGHSLFLERHEEVPNSMLVALAASRAFWSAGATSRAISWLGIGADRATELGRGELAERLRKKQTVLRGRQN